jgi:hypothetical protein
MYLDSTAQPYGEDTLMWLNIRGQAFFDASVSRIAVLLP